MTKLQVLRRALEKEAREALEEKDPSPLPNQILQIHQNGRVIIRTRQQQPEVVNPVRPRLVQVLREEVSNLKAPFTFSLEPTTQFQVVISNSSTMIQQKNQSAKTTHSKKKTNPRSRLHCLVS